MGLRESDQVYVYRWNRMGRKGQRCRVLARGAMNSCAVIFEDGFRAVTSRNALAKVKGEVNGVRSEDPRLQLDDGPDRPLA